MCLVANSIFGSSLVDDDTVWHLVGYKLKIGTKYDKKTLCRLKKPNNSTIFPTKANFYNNLYYIYVGIYH